jgi:hypothetical protein
VVAVTVGALYIDADLVEAGQLAERRLHSVGTVDEPAVAYHHERGRRM